MKAGITQIEFDDVLELVKVVVKYGVFQSVSDITDTVFDSPETHIPNWEERRPRAQRAWRNLTQNFFNTSFERCVLKKVMPLAGVSSAPKYLFTVDAVPWLEKYAKSHQFPIL